MTSKVVFGAGLPHVPVFPRLARDDSDLRARYAAVRAAMARSRPDLLVVIANDHLNHFFLDRLPTFSLALGDSVSGPLDEVPGVPTARLVLDTEVADRVAQELIAAEFDLTLSRSAAFDHSVAVPLHFLQPGPLPLLVLHVNAYVRPLPSAHRCHRLGTALGELLRELPGARRVGVVASGSFSQEVGGPRVDEGRSWSVPRPEWATRVAALLLDGAVEELIAETTPATLSDAGTVAGEVLSWITMVGALNGAGARVSPSIDHRPGEAFAFGSWEMS